MAFDEQDLMSPERYGQHGAPHHAWRWLRENDPVRWCEPEGFEPFWAITTHADIVEVSTQPEIFSNASGIVVLNDEQLATQDSENPLRTMKTIIEMDPPQHRDYRKVASGFFTPKGITELDQVVEESARQVIDDLGPEGECDFIEAITQQHPLRVLATILGIDADQEQRLLELTQQLFAGEDPDLRREGEDRAATRMELGMEFFSMFDGIIKDRQECPRDDLASLLANATLADGCPLETLETLGYYLIVFTAGHDTTRNALSGAIAAFLDHPDQLARLRAEPELAKTAVEEIVRWTTPVNYMKRTAMVDYELNGSTIREGDNLALFYASANRDAAVFDDPDTFDIARSPNRHLGFGWAEHYCLGAHLARASMKALAHQLAERVEVLEPAGNTAQTHSNFVVGLKALPVRYKFRS